MALKPFLIGICGLALGLALVVAAAKMILLAVPTGQTQPAGGGAPPGSPDTRLAWLSQQDIVGEKAQAREGPRDAQKAAVESAATLPDAADPGRTGHVQELVMARQLLMDGIESDMGAVESAIGSQKINFDDLKQRAYRIDTFLTAFPHLFSSDSKPSPTVPTATTMAVWDDFEAFFDLALTAGDFAFAASKAADVDAFAAAARQLRSACDGCHAMYMHVAGP